jgi:hypothetical protein
MRTILDAAAAYERALIRARTARSARDALERQGRIVNRGTKSAPKWWPVPPPVEATDG